MGRKDSEDLRFLMQKKIGKGFTKGIELELNLIFLTTTTTKKTLRGREERERDLLHRRMREAARDASGEETFPPEPAETAGCRQQEAGRVLAGLALPTPAHVRG